MGDAGFWARLVLAVLATWRVTYLLASEDGPADLLVRVRARLGSGLLGRLMDCFHCLSLWVAAPMAFLVARRPGDLLVSWLALSGAACLLERWSQAPVVMQPVSAVREGGGSHGVLWPEAPGGHEPGGARDETGIAPATSRQPTAQIS
jgi:hypothetical protein